jgi:flagellar hook-length control protein FliK
VISLKNLQELVAQAPHEKQAPHFAKLEQVFAKTLATAFKKDDEPIATPQHAVNMDVAHQLMVSAALQMVQTHVAVQTVNMASALSLSAIAPAKAASFESTDTGAINVIAHEAPKTDVTDERILAAFTEAMASTQQSPEAPKHADAPTAKPQIHATELVQFVARHISPSNAKVELIMQPPELGKVHLAVEVRNSEVHVHVTADSRDVAKILNDKLPQLESTLREQGLKVGSVSVMAGSAEAGLDTHTSDGKSRGSYDEAPEPIDANEQNPPKPRRHAGQKEKRYV